MSEYTLHKFRPTETIDAVLRLKGRHNYTREEIFALRKRFNELNGAVVPRPGQVFKIPLEGTVMDDYGNLLARAVDVPVVADPGGDGQKPANDEEGADPDDPLKERPIEPKSSTSPEDGA